MMEYRASLHQGRKGSSEHDERRFDTRNADHIFQEKTRLNVYVTFYSEESELEYYKAHYQKSLDAQNNRHLKKRNYSRIKTIDEVFKKKSPTEIIIQYAKSDELILEKKLFDEMVKSFAEKLIEWSSEHGTRLKVLGYYIHYDEKSPHAHIRLIWDYIDLDGNESVGQEEGMRQAGIDVDNPEKLAKDLAAAELIKEEAETFVSEWKVVKGRDGKADNRKPVQFSNKNKYDSLIKRYRSAIDNAHRYNNRCITWTRMERELWEKTIEEYGFKVNRNRRPKTSHLSKEQHLKKMIKEEEKLEEIINRQKEIIEKNEMIITGQHKAIDIKERGDEINDMMMKYKEIQRFM